MDDRALQVALEQALGEHLGRPLVVRALSLLAGGASRRIYGFEADVRGEAEPLALVARFGAAAGRIRGSGVDEFAVTSAAYDNGVVVPRVYCRGEVGGEGFYVMQRLAGEAIARRLLREDRYARARQRLPADIARSLARIHRMDVEDPRLDSLRAEAGAQRAHTDFAGSEIERYRELLRVASGGFPMPVLELTARWLERNRPVGGRRSVVHGDFRIGNVMFDEEGLTGILDWELAHLGDPLEDLGWLAVRAWRFGNDSEPIGGLCSRERFWSLYEREGGDRVDPAAARYWEVFGNWKWAVICVMQSASHKAGAYPDVELAAIGRRVAETEWEILRLLEEVERAG